MKILLYNKKINYLYDTISCFNAGVVIENGQMVKFFINKKINLLSSYVIFFFKKKKKSFKYFAICKNIIINGELTNLYLLLKKNEIIKYHKMLLEKKNSVIKIWKIILDKNKIKFVLAVLKRNIVKKKNWHSKLRQARKKIKFNYI